MNRTWAGDQLVTTRYAPSLAHFQLIFLVVGGWIGQMARRGGMAWLTYAARGG